jgi:gluconate 2-dehydrogenase gamma chain
VTCTSAQSQAGGLQLALDQVRALTTLSVSEQSVLEAVVETIIPSDSNGPGAREAGVLYFIDQQLNQQYGRSGNMFMEGPWVPANTTGSVTVDNITYSGGTANVRQGAGTRFQYVWNMREFWRIGLQALAAYANSAYGGNFETLSAANQLKCLQDLWANKPTAFNDIVPADFAYELTWMSWAGFLMDPVYGGNRNMVGWQYVGFNGTNQGNFYGEGHTVKELMVATTPTQLQPASLGQFQKGSP